MWQTIECPKCGTDNLDRLARCQVCGEGLHRDDEAETPRSDRGSLPPPRQLWRRIVRYVKSGRFPVIAAILLSALLAFACRNAALETPPNPSEILSRAANVASVRYDWVATWPPESQGFVDAARVWVKAHRMRVEIIEAEQTSDGYLIDWDAHTMYTWVPPENVIREMNNAWEIPEFTSATYWAKATATYNTSIVGSENVDGKACWVVQYAKEHPDGLVTGKAWISKGVPFLVRMEMTVASDKRLTIEFQNADFSDIPDSVFDLPGE